MWWDNTGNVGKLKNVFSELKQNPVVKKLPTAYKILINTYIWGKVYDMWWIGCDEKVQ